MIFYQDENCLTNEVIDRWINEIDSTYLKVAGKRAENIIKFKLSTEEILLRLQSRFGTETSCRIRGIKRSSGIWYEISIKGSSWNPLSEESDMFLPNDFLAKMGVNSNYYIYKESQNLNTVVLPAPLKQHKNAMMFGVLLGLVLAIVTWLISGLLGENVREGYLIPIISKLFSKMSSIFTAFATPLVFCAVISGICGIGDVSSFGKLGGRLLGRMLATYFIGMAVMVIIGLPMGLLSHNTLTGGESVFSEILNLVLDMIPGNLVEPFRVDNNLQVIILAVFIGVIILHLENKASRIRTFFDDAGMLCNRMMQEVCRFLPLFVYLGMANLLLGGKLEQMTSVTRIILLIALSSAITIGIVLVRALIVTGKPLKWIVSAQLPSLLINLTTSSQVSALPESIKCCKERWKIEDRFVDFGLPLGIVLYMPNGAILFGATIWVLTAYQGAADPLTLVKIVIVSIILAIAAPPMPGSACACLPILFSACGTDTAMMPLAILIASTMGYLLPAMNGFCLQLELLMSARKSGCVK